MSNIVLIAGMHRSGTSMVTRLLNLCGVYLGPESDLLPPQFDNLEGFWENHKFKQLNDVLLSELNGHWDNLPKVDFGWEKSNKFCHIRSKALALIQQFSSYQQWGWKDPRNTFTFPFWKELIPSMKVVICVRNPVEVANSLLIRNSFSHKLAYDLWFEYNQRIMLSSEPSHRIITCYESYFEDPYIELMRILKFLEMDVSEKDIRKSINTIDIQLRHNRSTLFDLMQDAPSLVINLYQTMYGETRQGSQERENTERDLRLFFVELIRARKLLAEKEQSIHVLNAQLDATKQELSEIYRSKAWRFIQMARRTRRKIFG